MCKRIKYTYNTIKKRIKQRGGVLLWPRSNKTKINSKIKIKIKCKYGHIWKPIVRRILYNKNWCRQCENDKKRYSLKFIKFIINKKRGILLTKVYKNAVLPLSVKCGKCKHIWKTSFSRISTGSWCPKCAGNKKYTIKEVQKEIKTRGGILLTKKYINGITSLDVICNKCKNIWHPTFNSVLNNHWCPTCCRQGQKQIKLFNILKNIFSKYKVENNYSKFPWLKNKNKIGIQRLDVYIHTLKLAIEYDGEQHYHPIRFSYKIKVKDAKKTFMMQRRLDMKKNNRIAAHPEDVKYFIRIPYTEPITKENVLKILKKNHVPIK